MKGMKHDQGKLDLTLVPPALAASAARAMAAGNASYARNSWLKLDDGGLLFYQALRRHLQAWEEGEDLDEQSGEHHFAHAVANLAFLLQFLVEGRSVGGFRFAMRPCETQVEVPIEHSEHYFNRQSDG